MTSRRNTIQKDLVRNTVYEMRRHVTANECMNLYLLERIHNTHGIEFVDYDISFKGICPKCREKK